MKSYLTSIEVLRPKHEKSQIDAIEWLAKAHTQAEITQLSLGEKLLDQAEGKQSKGSEQFQTEKFELLMKKQISRFGCDASKIANRGHEIDDFAKSDFAENEIFLLKELPGGKGIEKRNEMFDKFASQKFMEFYKDISPNDKSVVPNNLVHVTCSGYVSPSPAQKLVASKNWGKQTHVSHAYHMGCYASIPALRMAIGFNSTSLQKMEGLENTQTVKSDIVHTELCTLHFNPANHSPEQLVVQSLFADGFAKYSVVSDANSGIPSLLEGRKEKRVFEILNVEEWVLPESSHSMTWALAEQGMKMTLARDVPETIGKHLIDFVRTICESQKLNHGIGLGASDKIDIESILKNAYFAIHPGGPKIIDSCAAILGLNDWQISASKEVLKKFGNMSSATLPHVWSEMERTVEVGKVVVSLAFGPGLTMCGAVFLRV